MKYIFLACCAVMVFRPAKADPIPERPNFIVILCDNLGYGDIEPFGSKVNRTPHLNRMAKEGGVFTHFYASSGVCTPSRASLITGCYAQRVGMHLNDRDGPVLRPLSPFCRCTAGGIQQMKEASAYPPLCGDRAAYPPEPPVMN